MSSSRRFRNSNSIGVTVLTNLDQKMMNDELRVPGDVSDQVYHLAQLADKAGLNGIVCSARDLTAVTPRLRNGFMYVTPGIQGVSTGAGSDQKRVDSPGNAIKNGSSLLVVGRAITSAETRDKRLQAGYEIIKDIAKYI